jgi:hypothetical protein
MDISVAHGLRPKIAEFEPTEVLMPETQNRRDRPNINSPQHNAIGRFGVSVQHSAAIRVVSMLFASWVVTSAGAVLQMRSINVHRGQSFGIPTSSPVDIGGRLEHFDIERGGRLIFCLPGSDKFC